jgi:enamine deaminase RidA (YjgF/YER057c/UK114 family)
MGSTAGGGGSIPTDIERVKPANLFPDAPYAYASVAPAGDLVFTAGACPLDEDGVTVSPGDLEAQTERALQNLFVTLAAAGSAPHRVLKTTVYVVAGDRADLVRAWNVVKAGFGELDPPSTLLGVGFLGYAEQLVEIEAIATTGAPAIADD